LLVPRRKNSELSVNFRSAAIHVHIQLSFPARKTHSIIVHLFPGRALNLHTPLPPACPPVLSQDDFCYLHKDIANRPTRLQEIVLLDPVAEKYHDVFGFACGGVVIPNDTACSRNNECIPIGWRASFPEEAIQKRLVFSQNLNGDINNSDLELVAGIVSNYAAAQNFDIQERAVYSNTDNTPTMFWMRKGSATTGKAPAFLLRAQALHQQFHHYVHCIDYIKGEHNDISDIPSRKPTLVR